MNVPRHFVIKIETPDGEILDKYEIANGQNLTAVLGHIGGKHQMMELPVHNIGMKTLLAVIFMAIVDAESKDIESERTKNARRKEGKV